MAKKKVFSIGTALSRGLEETIESAQTYSGELRVDVVPLRKIDLDPVNPRDLALTLDDVFHGVSHDDLARARKLSELESLQSMANSIKAQGIINPITVYKQGERYGLIAGERRTLASIIAGKTDIQAKILHEKPDALKISLLQWIENIERSDLTLGERLSNLEKIANAYAKTKGMQADKISVTELSNLIGCVKSHAMNYKAILQADPALKALIHENKISNLKKAAFLAELGEAAGKQVAIDACLAGATLEQLKVIINQHQFKLMVKPVEKRGRQSTEVSFGSTKHINVAKLIIDALLENIPTSPLVEQVRMTDWSNHRSVSATFKQVLKNLEKIYA